VTAVRAILWGGYSYVWPDQSAPYPSLADALADWSDMRTFGRTRDGLYAPCWGEVDVPEPEGRTYVGHAWLADEDDDDPIASYPDWVLVIGRRDGLRWERA